MNFNRAGSLERESKVWGFIGGHNCNLYIDFTEIRKQMFEEIGLSLLHLFPHRVDVSPLEKKP